MGTFAVIDSNAENRPLTQQEKHEKITLSFELQELGKEEETSWRQKFTCLWLKERGQGHEVLSKNGRHTQKKQPHQQINGESGNY